MRVVQIERLQAGSGRALRIGSVVGEMVREQKKDTKIEGTN